MKISNRQLEAYKRSEAVAKELRYQLSHWQEKDENRLADMVIHWMAVAKKSKYDRPELPKNRHSQHISNSPKSI